MQSDKEKTAKLMKEKQAKGRTENREHSSGLRGLTLPQLMRKRDSRKRPNCKPRHKKMSRRSSKLN